MGLKRSSMTFEAKRELARQTDEAAKSVTHSEALARAEKTARLRAMRLASESGVTMKR